MPTPLRIVLPSESSLELSERLVVFGQRRFETAQLQKSAFIPYHRWPAGIPVRAIYPRGAK